MDAPHTHSLLAHYCRSEGERGSWGSRNFLPLLFTAHTHPPISNPKAWQGGGGGREGLAPTCALCPSQSTLAMSPRQRKKVTRTTPTMKGSDDPSPLCLRLSSRPDDPFGRNPWEVMKSAFIKVELLLEKLGLNCSSATAQQSGPGEPA